MALNMKQTLNGEKLTIEIDLTQKHGPSGSGKSITIASSGGNISVEGRPDVKLGLNVYTKNTNHQPAKKGKKG